MTLDELQVVITANIAQIMPQVMEARKAFQSLQQSADTAGDGIDKSMSDTSKATQSALDKSNAVEQKSAQATQKAAATKRQSLEEIAAIAERAAQQYRDSVSGMGGDGGPLHEPVALQSKQPEPEVAAAPADNTPAVTQQVSAFQRLQDAAQRVRQSIAGMFSGAQQGEQGASEAVQELTAKLDNINARADIQRQKLASLQAEYARVASQAGGSGGDEAMALQEKILTTEARLQSLTAQSDKTADAIRELDDGLDETKNAGERAAQGAQKASTSFRSASSGAGGFEQALGRIQNQIFRNLVVYGLLIKGIQSVGEYMWNALKTNTAFSNSLNNLKVQFLTAFNPIYQAILPALTALIQGLATAVNYIAAFISALFGKTYQQSRQSAAALNNNVKALQDTTKATKDAANASKDATLGFDQLNIIKPDDKSNTDKPATGADAGLVNTDFSTPSSGSLIPQSAITAAQQAGQQLQKVFKDIYGWANQYLFTPIRNDFSKGWNISAIQSSLNNLKQAFTPFAQNVGQGLKWFIDNVLSPLAHWVVNKVVPEFLKLLSDTISDVNDVINDLKPLGQWLWDNFLKPLAEWTGGQIIKILDDLDKGLKNVGDWIKDHKEAVQNIAIVIGSFAAAWVLVNAAIAIWNVVSAIGAGLMAALTSPITLVVVAIGLLIAAVVLCIKYWPQISEAAGKAWDAIKGFWQGVGAWFGQRWQDIQNAFKDVKSWFSNAFSTAWTAVQTAFKDVSKFFGTVWSDITEAFKTGGVDAAAWFKNTFNTAYSNITKAFADVSQFFSKVWSDITGAFKTAGIDVATWFKNAFDDAYSNVTGAFKTASVDFGKIWSAIKGAFSVAGDDVSTWFTNTFTSGYNAITTAFGNIGSFFENIWISIKGSFRDFLNSLIGGLNSFGNEINKVISTISKIPVFAWASGIRFTPIQPITALASGGLAYGTTLAMVGDNPGASSNPEVIAPLDKLKSIMGNDNSDVVNALQTLISVVQSKDFSATLNLDGRTAAKAVNRGNRGLGAPILGGAFAH